MYSAYSGENFYKDGTEIFNDGYYFEGSTSFLSELQIDQNYKMGLFDIDDELVYSNYKIEKL